MNKIIWLLQNYNSVFLRFYFSYCGDKLNVLLKKQNLVHLYGIENLFGYRLDSGIEEEILEDAKNWFGVKNEHDNIQKNFFLFYFEEALNYKFPNQKEDFYLRKPVNFNYLNQFNADGSASQQKKLGVKSKGKTKVKKIGISKTIFYSDMDLEEYEKIFYSKEIIGKSDSVMILKSESVKVRGVVNTDINSYPILSKITKLIQSKLTGKIGIYSTMTNKQKIKLGTLFSHYINYNVKNGNKYIFLPLDYSKFDHTISKKLILTCMRQFSKYMLEVVGYDEMVDSFSNYLEDHYVQFTKKDGSKIRIKYENGMLSGWKFTNLIESIINFVISFGVTQQLIKMFPEYRKFSLELLVTMGDDIVIILKQQFINERLDLDLLLKRISLIYETIGFKVNPSKNSISYTFIEFLRIYYTSEGSYSYPLRGFQNLFLYKPYSGESHIDASNYYNLVELISRKNFFTYNMDKFLKMLESINKKVRAIRNISEKVYHFYNYKQKVTLSSISHLEEMNKNGVLYNFLKNIFPSKNDEELIIKYIEKSFSKIESKITLEKRKNLFDTICVKYLHRLNLGYTNELYDLDSLKNKIDYTTGVYILDQIIREKIDKSRSLKQIDWREILSKIRQQYYKHNMNYNLVNDIEEVLRMFEYYNYPKKYVNYIFKTPKFFNNEKFFNSMLNSMVKKTIIKFMFKTFLLLNKNISNQTIFDKLRQHGMIDCLITITLQNYINLQFGYYGKYRIYNSVIN